MSSLQDAFIEDHKVLTRGLATTASALRHGDLQAATRAADTLDQQAGAHIEFEERFFYPEVARSRGTEYVANLHREHDAGRDAIRTLLASQGRGELSEDDETRVLAQLDEALDHTVACGTLLSHLTTLDAGRQNELLGHLLQLRREGPRWTKSERHTPPPADPPPATRE